MRNQAVILRSWLVIAAWSVDFPPLVGGDTNEILAGNHRLTSNRRRIQSSSGRRRLRGQKIHAIENKREQQVEAVRSNVYDKVLDQPGNEIDKIMFRKLDDSAIPSCEPVKLDFQKAADGRNLNGGSFVQDEWHSLGIRIKSYSQEGKKDVHPMIFDSFDVESNGFQNNDIYFLGSPNFDCGGFGVGRGGQAGKSGENCEPLGNLLIPARRSAIFSSNYNKKEKGSLSSTSEMDEGGIITFEFKRYAEVTKIGLLNVMEGSELQVVHNDGVSETIELTSVGTNGYQKINVAKSNVEKLHVSFSSLAGVASVDLCLEVGDEEATSKVYDRPGS
jgi:hypothetical protein